MTDVITEVQEPVDYSKAPQRILSAALCHVEDAWCLSRISEVGGLYLHEYCFADGSLDNESLLPSTVLEHANHRKFPLSALADGFTPRVAPCSSSWVFFAITKATYPVMTAGEGLISLLPTVSADGEDVLFYRTPSERIKQLSAGWSYAIHRHVEDAKQNPMTPNFMEENSGKPRMLEDVQWSVGAPNLMTPYRGTLPIWDLGHAGYVGQRCRYSGRLCNHRKPETATYLWGSRAAAELVSCYMVQRINLTYTDNDDDCLSVYHEAVAFPGLSGYDRARNYIKLQAELLAETYAVYNDTLFNRTLYKGSTPSAYAVQPRSGLYGTRSVPVTDSMREMLLQLKSITLFSDVVMTNGVMTLPQDESTKSRAKRELVKQHENDVLGVIAGGCWD